jgi:hypothetical protein
MVTTQDATGFLLGAAETGQQTTHIPRTGGSPCQRTH